MAGFLTRLSDGLRNVVTGLGTSRDKSAYSEYSIITPLTYAQLEVIYRSSWLAGRIIDCVADDMTREWVIFNEKAAIDLKDITALEKKYRVRDAVNEALKWARLYGGSAIVIGIANEDLSEPLDLDSIQPNSLEYLRVFDRHRFHHSGSIELVEDIAAPRFGHPIYYSLINTNIKIHYSRMLFFDGRKLPYNSWLTNDKWHESELQKVIESFICHDTARQAINILLMEANVDVITADGFAKLIDTKDGEKKAIDRYQLAGTLKGICRMLILDGAEKYDRKQINFSGVNEVWHEFRVDAAGAADIPITRLYGQSPGGLNATGESDLANYKDRLSAEREKQLRLPLELLYEVIFRSGFGKLPDDFSFEFAPLWKKSAKEEAEIIKLRAETDKIYWDIGSVTAGLIARELRDSKTYKCMEDADVALAESMEKPMNEDPAPGAIPPGSPDNLDEE